MPSSIICPLQLHACKNPDHPFLISSTKIITYAQADRMASSVAVKMTALSLKPEARVGVCAFSTPEHVIFLIGLWRAGLTACILDPELPIQTIDRRLQDTHAQLLFMDPVLNLEDEGNAEHRHTWRYDAGRPLTILLTSGTSARPKAVLHSWDNHYHSALGSNEFIPFMENDRWFLTLPLFHVSGLSVIFRAMIAGGAIVMGDYRRFSVAADSEAVTHASFVSTQLYRLMRSQDNISTLKRLKAILLGGGAIPQTLIDRCIEEDLPVHISYGLTEMASQVATSVRIRQKDDRKKISVLKYRQLQIKPDGEILVKGETLFKGYVSGDLLMQPFDKDGWFATGDLGEWDSEGRLQVIGRKDNMFVSGGENIHPEEIEYYLCLHPAVEQAVVVPVQDAEFGQRPAAFVQFREGPKVSGREMTEHLLKDLPKFKIPVKFFSWQDDPDAPAVKPGRRYFQAIVDEWFEKGTSSDHEKD